MEGVEKEKGEVGGRERGGGKGKRGRGGREWTERERRSILRSNQANCKVMFFLLFFSSKVMFSRFFKVPITSKEVFEVERCGK